MRESLNKFVADLRKSRKRTWNLVFDDGRREATPPVSVEKLVRSLEVWLAPARERHKNFPNEQKAYQPMVCWYPAIAPETIKYFRVGLITLTSKMRAPSFGLSAGPEALGGTCPASALSDEAGYVCHNCYATSGNYANPNNVLFGVVRKIFVEQEMRRGTLVRTLSDSIRAFRVDSKIVDSDGNRPNMDYFRIHDTGDVGWLDDYYDAWIKVARAFPHVKFWMPTRVWAIEDLLKELRKKRPANLIVRPSGLMTDEEAPTVRGLDAGTSVCFDDAWEGKAQHNCPAVVNNSNCDKEECRKCWNEPKMTVNYQPHGHLTEKVRGAMKKNPGTGLDALWGDFVARQPRRNPPGVAHGEKNFAEHIRQVGHALGEWSLAEWERFLAGQGLSETEIGQWLDEHAEYD